MVSNSNKNARRKGLSNRTTNAMLVVSVIMYGASATHWVIEIVLTIQQSNAGKRKVQLTHFESLAGIYVPAINVCRSVIT